MRFARFGKKGMPFYRLVVVDSRSARDGRYIDNLGYYDPAEKASQDGDSRSEKSLRRDKIKEWFSKGAKASLSVSNFLSRSGLLKEYTDEVSKDSKPKKKISAKKDILPLAKWLNEKRF